MAESMTRRRKAMAAAWEKARQNLGIWPPPTDYEDGFNAAWDALMAEIREAAVKAEKEWQANGLETICSLDCLIDMRLRERLRELAVLDRLEHLPPEDRPSAIVADAVRLIRDLDCSAELAARNASARALTILSREARHV